MSGRSSRKLVVKVQLLQTMSILVQNIERQTTLFYLFSNNHVNTVITADLDWEDEEILSYYVTFMKSLALRLNAETAKFFFNDRRPFSGAGADFPLYTEAIRFFDHRDPMVRTSVRTLTLAVLKVPDSALRDFVACGPYFVHLACHLRDLWTRQDRLARQGADVSGCGDVSDEIDDLLLYLSDIFSLQLARVPFARLMADF